MMFGQTKLETRVYEIYRTWPSGGNEIFHLSEITGYELDYYLIQPINFEGEENWSLICVEDPQFSYNEGCLRRNPNSNIQYYGGDDSQQAVINSGTFFLDQVFCGGYLKLAITAEFPQEDTGYIEDGFDYCVEPGANLMSYPCDSDVALIDAIPSDALSQFSGIIGQGLASVQLPNGTWVGSLTNMQASSGYWITSNTSLCFNYDCSEN